MEIKLYAGSLGDWDIEDSMAKEIERSLNLLLGPLPSTPPKLIEERRKLFIAIANGVINHMKVKQDAFKITYNFGEGTDDTTPDIQVKDGI